MTMVGVRASEMTVMNHYFDTGLIADVIWCIFYFIAIFYSMCGSKSTEMSG